MPNRQQVIAAAICLVLVVGAAFVAGAIRTENLFIRIERTLVYLLAAALFVIGSREGG